ncbi:hypothetical protein C4J94_3733 [Pseudomonas sp. R5-89-07]|nr:hypothetical protein C4J94_3733 [Pseudomonas sp. R5-89-07]
MFCIPDGCQGPEGNLSGKYAVRIGRKGILRAESNHPDNAKCRMHDGLSCKLHENKNSENL